MSEALVRARAAAVIATLERVALQSVSLDDRITRAEMAGDYVLADQLREIADSCRLSADQYRDELQNLTGQHRLAL